MAIDDATLIDGVAIDKECGQLILLLTDHLEWKKREYDITENCEEFLQAVQDQVGQYGIKIEAHIS